MRPIFVLQLVALLSSPVLSADAPTERTEAERARMKAVADEVARRRALREAVTAARHALRELETKQPPAATADLAAARATLRQAEARAPQVPGTSPPTASLPAGKAMIKLPDADMKTVASMCAMLFGGTVTVAERVSGKIVKISLTADSPDEMREKLSIELRKHGLALSEVPGGKLLDLAPDLPRNP